MAELAYRRGHLKIAWQAIDRVLMWLKESFDQEMSIARYLTSAWLALAEKDISRANSLVRDGLSEAEEWGYGIYWIDLKIAQGRVNLALGDRSAATKSADQALNQQARNDQAVFGARSSECGYLWGQADALELLAESSALQGDRERANQLRREVQGMSKILQAQD